MWIITYLTDVCEKLFENLEVGFTVTYSAPVLAFLLDNFDTDRMSISFLGVVCNRSIVLRMFKTQFHKLQCSYCKTLKIPWKPQISKYQNRLLF